MPWFTRWVRLYALAVCLSILCLTLGLASSALAGKALGLAVPATSSARLRDEAARVELALMGDPICYPLSLQVSVAEGSIRIKGLVSDEKTREHILAVARQSCYVPVEADWVQPTPAAEPKANNSLERLAVATLQQKLGSAARGLSVTAQPDGHILLRGEVASMQAKLHASRCLHGLPGCTQIINCLTVKGVMAADGVVQVGGQMSQSERPPEGLSKMPEGSKMPEDGKSTEYGKKDKDTLPPPSPTIQPRLPRLPCPSPEYHGAPYGATLPSGLPPILPHSGHGQYSYVKFPPPILPSQGLPGSPSGYWTDSCGYDVTSYPIWSAIKNMCALPRGKGHKESTNTYPLWGKYKGISCPKCTTCQGRPVVVHPAPVAAPVSGPVMPSVAPVPVQSPTVPPDTPSAPSSLPLLPAPKLESTPNKPAPEEPHTVWPPAHRNGLVRPVAAGETFQSRPLARLASALSAPTPRVSPTQAGVSVPTTPPVATVEPTLAVQPSPAPQGEVVPSVVPTIHQVGESAPSSSSNAQTGQPIDQRSEIVQLIQKFGGNLVHHVRVEIGRDRRPVAHIHTHTGGEEELIKRLAVRDELSEVTLHIYLQHNGK